MKNTFGQWFKKVGWRSCVLPFLGLCLINWAIIMTLIYMPDTLWGAPIPVIIGIGIAYFGFSIGICDWIYVAYKDSEK